MYSNERYGFFCTFHLFHALIESLFDLLLWIHLKEYLILEEEFRHHRDLTLILFIQSHNQILVFDQISKDSQEFFIIKSFSI